MTRKSFRQSFISNRLTPVSHFLHIYRKLQNKQKFSKDFFEKILTSTKNKRCSVSFTIQEKKTKNLKDALGNYTFFKQQQQLIVLIATEDKTFSI